MTIDIKELAISGCFVEYVCHLINKGTSPDIIKKAIRNHKKITSGVVRKYRKNNGKH